ncbi:helix-turn-helix transcriptional regulator [Nocardia yamanashiensis]|uniref:helix-turn-helix domain-containing protein n=1 Tax=Nocardia yamanashiensis TaxID=209247 RepID=UPI001E2964BD|nr:helix-turn-helix domain-containing protein [Nocardia yamanashiensis]UGT41249.1 helix-turn-helix transcriptional regulator [Nocardia yamanashiensis]
MSALCMSTTHPIAPPTLGAALRRMRDERKLSRERLAFNAGVSASYINQLEKGTRARPTRDVLAAVMRVLDHALALSAGQRRELLTLAGHGETEPPGVEQLRALIEPALGAGLASQPATLVGYYDDYWNLLAGNDLHTATFPGMRENGNALRWMLTDARARHILPEWEHEVAIAVRVLRGRLARTASAARTRKFLTEMGSHHQFRTLWQDGAVAYTRDRPRLWLREPRTHRIRSVITQHLGVLGSPPTAHIQLITGVLPA